MFEDGVYSRGFAPGGLCIRCRVSDRCAVCYGFQWDHCFPFFMCVHSLFEGSVRCNPNQWCAFLSQVLLLLLMPTQAASCRRSTQRWHEELTAIFQSQGKKKTWIWISSPKPRAESPWWEIVSLLYLKKKCTDVSIVLIFFFYLQFISVWESLYRALWTLPRGCL